MGVLEIQLQFIDKSRHERKLFGRPDRSADSRGIISSSLFPCRTKECPFAAQRPSRPQTDLSNKAYSLADAMRDAVWRKKTTAKLKSLLGRFSNSGACPRSSLDGVRGPGLTLW